MQYLTFKTQIYFDDEKSIEYVERAFGVRRWIWNWFLSYILEQRKLGNPDPNFKDLLAAFRAAVAARHDDEFQWIIDNMVTTRVLEETAKDISTALKICKDAQKEADRIWKANIYKKKDKRKDNKHYRKKEIKPKFKSKKDRDQTFSIINAVYSIGIISEYCIRFAGTKGLRPTGRVRESLSFLMKKKVEIKRITIKKEGGKYWLCIAYTIPKCKVYKPTSGKIGIDLGVKISVTSFDGSKIDMVSFNTNGARHSERLAQNVDLSKKVEGSKRYEKSVVLKERRYMRSRNQRNEYLEWYTTYLCRNYKEIVIDNFNFKGALKVADNDQVYHSMKYQFMLRLNQKATYYGITVREVNHSKGQKTTHKCAHCGSTNVSVGKDRIMHCNDCGEEIDRDVNSAMICFTL